MEWKKAIDQMLMRQTRGIGSGGRSGYLDHIDASVSLGETLSGLGRVLLIGCESEPAYSLGVSNYKARSMWRMIRQWWNMTQSRAFKARAVIVPCGRGSGLIEACELSCLERYFIKYFRFLEHYSLLEAGFSFSSHIQLGKERFLQRAIWHF